MRLGVVESEKRRYVDAEQRALSSVKSSVGTASYHKAAVFGARL